jgi:hypothetical protein
VDAQQQIFLNYKRSNQVFHDETQSTETAKPFPHCVLLGGLFAVSGDAAGSLVNSQLGSCPNLVVCDFT